MSEVDQKPENSDAADPNDPAQPSEFVENYAVLRQVFFERYFRVAAVLLVLFLVFLGLFLPKIYTSTPEGIEPVYKMSGLDKLQAWSLARSAREKITAGNFSDALLSWRSAIANDPGDPKLSEGLVRTVLDHPVARRENLSSAAYHAVWLMKLTGTNDSSVELAVRLFAKFSLDDYVVGLLAPKATNLPPAQAAEFLKSLFRQSRMDQFGEYWTTYSNALAGDRDMQLHLAAWRAGWGPPATIREGREALEAARKDPATRDQAARLSLPIAFSLSDPAVYQANLAALVDNHADRVIDHLNYWRLLIGSGRMSQAAELARGFSRPPETPAEAASMVGVLVELGMRDYAAKFLEQHLPTFAFRPELWESLADLHISLKQWQELRDLAVQMRQSPYLRDDMAGYSWFLEGLSALRTQRIETAREAFVRAAESPTTNPLLSFKVSKQLSQLGYPTLATQLLQSLEKAYGDLAAYWFAVVGAAYEARQFDTMREAAARGYQLRTNEAVFINNYAAMLLMQRTNPAVAVQLTLKALAARPNNPGMQINHAQALILNDRLDEAEELLRQTKIGELDSYLLTERNCAFFDLYAKRGDREKALKAYDGIEPRFLFLPQLKWLDETYAKLTGEKRPRPGL
jgi:tetratricopeptide (TPR) repeat protein